MPKEIPSAAAEARKQEFKAIRNEIEKCELQVKVANEIIAGGNRDLDVALDSSKLNLVLDKKDSLRKVKKLKSKKAKISS